MRHTRLSAAYPSLGMLAALLVLSTAGLARAEDPQHAKELFKQGSVYFDLGQYDRAIEAWQKGYEEKQDPGFLYNIAQAYRLAGDPRKAIQFYKSFLRNSPRATNRDEIDQKIAQLQKQLGDSEPKNATSPSTSPPASPWSSTSPSPSTEPAVLPPTPSQPTGSAGPIATPTSATSTGAPPSAMQVATAPALPTGPVAAERERPIDLGVALGANAWMSGVQGSAQPSFAAAVTAGYTFRREPPERARFRLGVVGAYTFLDDISSKVTFVSVLVDPSVRIRIARAPLFLNGDVGLGVLAVSGLKQDSALLARDTALMVTGTQAFFEVRPGLALEYQLRTNLTVSGGSSLPFSPQKTNFYQPLLRLEFHLGFGFRI